VWLRVNSNPLCRSWNVLPILTSRARLVLCSVSRPICDELNLLCNLGELLWCKKLAQITQGVCRHPKPCRPMAVKPSKVIDDITHPNPVFIVSVWHKMMEWPLFGFRESSRKAGRFIQ
jgi:hypothetical protein